MGGQALSPPSSCSCFVFYVKLKEFYKAQFFKKLSYSCIRDIFIPGPTIDTVIMARETSRIGKKTLVSS